MKHPVHGAKHYHVNIELIEFARRTNIPVPTDYGLAQVNIQMLKNDFAKFKRSNPWWPNEIAFNNAKQAFLKIFSFELQNSEVLSFDEAVQLMEKSTSPGFPWNKQHQTKKECLECRGDEVRLKVENIFKGIWEQVLWQVSPKVEIRTYEKLSVDKKQRTFMSGDVVFQIVGMMLYYDMNQKFLKLCDSEQHWSALGLTQFYGGWHKLADHLSSQNYAQDMLCFDISAMEASVNSDIQEFLYTELRHEALDDEDLVHAKEFYLVNMIYSLLVDPEGILTMKFGGNPSGAYNTLSDNTMVVILTLLYNVACVYDDIPKIIEYYSEHPTKVLGDDTITSKDEISMLYPEHAKDLGFKVTYECEPCPLRQSTFLSNGWLWDDAHAMYVPKPNVGKLFANIFYNRKANSWRLVYAKLCGMRILLFPMKHYRIMIDNMLHFIQEKYVYELKNEDFDKISYAQLLTMRLTDADTKFLIYGGESCGSADKYKTANKVLIQCLSLLSNDI